MGTPLYSFGGCMGGAMQGLCKPWGKERGEHKIEVYLRVWIYYFRIPTSISNINCDFCVSSVTWMNMATTTTAPIVKDIEPEMTTNHKPHLTHTTTNISLSPEQFERLYLAPKTPHATDNAARFANPVALGFLGCRTLPFLAPLFLH